jgi:hypothetical protein
MRSAVFLWMSFFSSLLALHTSLPILISDTREESKSPSVAINGRGDIAIAWIGAEKFLESIRVICRNSQGQWIPPKVVSEEKERIAPPQCFLSYEGNAYVLWEGTTGTQYVKKNPQGSWTYPISIAANLMETNISRSKTCAFDGKGRFLFLKDRWEPKGWLTASTTTAQVLVKRSNYSEEEVLTPPGAEHSWYSDPRYSTGAIIGSNQLGDALMIWRRGYGGLLEGSWVLPDGTFTDAEQVSDTSFIHISDIAIDLRKNVALIGVQSDQIQALTCTEGTWSKWVALSEKEKKKEAPFRPLPQLAVDNRGNLLATWKTETDNNEVYIEMAYKEFNQEWSHLEKVRLEGKVEKLIVRSDQNENFIILWEERKGRSDSGIYCMEFSAKQRAWSSIFKLSPEMDFCTEPSLEFSQNGQGVLVWTKKSSQFDSWIEMVELSLNLSH